MKSPGFVHLHVHSSFSLLEGALSIARLAELAKADKQPALALTDTNNMFAALEFSEKMAGSGIQPIVGCDISVDFGDQEADPRMPGGLNVKHPRIVLLAATEEGYGHLIRLTSRAFLETPSGQSPHIRADWLAAAASGLIVLSGGATGALDMEFAAGRPERAAARSAMLQSLFGDRYYIELQRHGAVGQRAIENALVDLAYEKGVPLVATNEPFFAREDDYEAHDALIAIADGRLVSEADRRQMTSEHRFKTRAEMQKLFADLPEALASTVEIAQRCSYRPRTRKPILPRFTSDVGTDAEAAEAAELRRQAVEGLERRIRAHGLSPGVEREVYDKRLDYEVGVITRMKFPGYFLIVADFIKWAKEHGIPVGPGRGSGAGSLVAYALTITDLDPIHFGLLFERFLNEERVSMPDFDIDFCQWRRDEVIRYVQDRYGRDQVAQIITFGTLQARGVLRDVGRVLEMPYGQVDKLTKLVPQNPAAPVTLKKAIDEEPKLQAARDAEPVVARAFNIALRLEGLHRHASTHAAGIVIGDRPLSELVPMYRDPKSDMPVTQFNMKWVEPAGLVKFDFLGLTTLTILDVAVKLVANRGIKLDLTAIPLDDAKAYEMMARGETVGVFQVESQGMRRALLDMKPDRLEDIIALVALYRPGPMANIPTYCARKHGEEESEYLHPKMEEALKETFGVIIYQEQVMQIAQMLAGYSLGEADLLRRAMGKKIKKEMEAQRERFVSGSVERGIDAPLADTIFELLARFADYGFNKSHAAAYALVSYQTAYMKANYPVEFLAACMTLAMDNTDKLAEYRAEVVRLGLKLAPPSINRSGVHFSVEDGAIRYSLAALKGVGAQAVEQIVAARAKGRFRDLSDFASRISPKAINKRVLESLASAGAFDELEPDRARAHAAVDAMMAQAQRSYESATSGQNELFGGAAMPEALPIPRVQPWMPSERLRKEYEAIGFFLTGHPLDDYTGVMKRLKLSNYADFARQVKAGATAGRVAATVVSRQERRTKTGNKMGIIGLSDPTGHYEAVLFSEGLQQFRELLEPGAAVLLFVAAELQGEDVRVRIQAVEPLDKAAEKTQRGLKVFLRDQAPIDSVARRLEVRGDGEVSMVLLLDAAEVEIKLPGRFKISPQIAGAIKAVPGVIQVEAI
ncbi:DNA polymerase III subunit alpha [Variibacter gotjawalensis]|uniref:DNA polymerase III subunit alpha n=1 Tax=Variibacter gotjawalensis TaxID=1333996 RepID=A0A0S3PXS2_9BRAD|nr:DNA polymerase III subunit alpha [Variibacter gotjawalensis]NIK46582.1 DNA polymerase-3 subunit alpha [Variibacter gotjawalensis]RZS48486.1 DNA polymerase III alpha subunit [Variibacter gotjawalensis]BAT60748.1 DNA polymerase III subunit alpha [Variibacter gotjawalensis]